MDPQLAELVDKLRARGVEVRGLERVAEELEEQPWHARVRAFAATQWAHVRGEVDETEEAWALVRKAVEGELTPREEATLTAQLQDLARMVPAAALTVAIEAIPVPGTSVLTPVVLVKLGLLPSRWREARVVRKLREQAEELRALGEGAAAEEVDALVRQLTLERDARELLGAELRLHWDTAGDGWDREDVVAYDSALDRTRAADPHARRFYVAYREEVFGPVRLSDLPEDLDALVSFERTGFVKRSHLL